MKTSYLSSKVMSRWFFVLGVFLSQSFISISQCTGNFIIEDPEDFHWTYHPVSATNPEAYYSGTMEVGDTTFTFNNGETLTTRAYKQKGKTIDFISIGNTFGNIANFKRMRHMVFSREGKPCLLCSDTIIKVIQSSRRIYVCPTCQNYKS